MENKLKNVLKNFVNNDELNDDSLDINVNNVKKTVGDKSLIERFNKIIVDEKGRQLLREQY